MNMVSGPLWWRALGTGPLLPLNPALGALLCIGVTWTHLKFCGYTPWFMQLLNNFARNGDSILLLNFKLFTGMSF